jgi:Phosphotransferase enzyme family
VRSAKGVVSGFEGEPGSGPSVFLQDVTALLQARRTDPGGSPSVPKPRGPSRPLLVLPNEHAPRVLLPRSPRRVARGVIAAQSVTRSRTDQLMRWGAAGAITLGLGSLLSRSHIEIVVDGGIEEYLSDLLGCRVRIGIRLGPPRANRKPVLTVCDLQGKVKAFAKLGVDPLTDRLVKDEAKALEDLAGQQHATLCVPALLHAVQWAGHQLVVQTALPVRGAGSDDPALVARAMGEVATGPGETVQDLATSPFATGLTADLGRIDQDFAADLADAAGGILGRSTELSFGAWHGDWSPSNMHCDDGKVYLWDWERYSTGVPVGMDAVHFAFWHGVTRRGMGHETSARACLANAASTLEPIGIPAADAPLVAALSLLAVGLRYAGDRQADAGGQLGRLDGWLIPALRAWTASTDGGRR